MCAGRVRVMLPPPVPYKPLYATIVTRTPTIVYSILQSYAVVVAVIDTIEFDAIIVGEGRKGSSILS